MRYLMHNLAVYMPYIQRESLQDMSWWNKTRTDVIKDVDIVWRISGISSDFCNIMIMQNDVK